MGKHTKKETVIIAEQGAARAELNPVPRDSSSRDEIGKCYPVGE